MQMSSGSNVSVDSSLKGKGLERTRVSLYTDPWHVARSLLEREYTSTSACSQQENQP